MNKLLFFACLAMEFKLVTLVAAFFVFRVSDAAEANLVLLEDAVSTGAVCLDGSPPGYYFRPGTGDGARSWIVHMEGGGVCSTEQDCADRSKSKLGSSKNWEKTAIFDGFLSDNNDTNTGFYNWNVAFLMYCDGSSFGGYREKPIDVNGTMVYIRGSLILEENIKALLLQGMSSAERIILTGCSAGGIGTYLHADYVKTLLPESASYHAMADAGYFIDAPNIHGVDVFRQIVLNTFTLHNTTSSGNPSCMEKYSDELWKCGMAQYVYPFITTPMFTLNSAFDTWQLKNTLQLDCHPDECPPEEKEQFEDYGKKFLAAAAPVISSFTNGVFVDSCLEHCQSLNAHSWSQIKVEGQTALETFSNWYFHKAGSSSKVVDCDTYPCNPTC